MLARDQSLLLQPAASPAVGLRHVYRCFRLARAWQKLGGAVTLIHDDLPSRLVSQLASRQIDFRRQSVSDSQTRTRYYECVAEIASQSAAGWVVIDGDEGQTPLDRSQLAAAAGSRDWKLVAMDEGTDLNVARQGNIDLLIAPDRNHCQLSFQPVTQVLTGERYRIPLTERPSVVSGSETAALPRIARKLLVWLSEDDSVERLRKTLADVIEVASEKTSIDVVASTVQRDSAAIVRLKKANPQVTLRFWGSVERRLQSMAPVQLAIVDDGKNLQTLAICGIPVVQLQSVEATANADDFVESEPTHANGARLEVSSQTVCRRSLSRLIRDSAGRQELADAGLMSCHDQAADRIARRLASARLTIEPATSGDWQEVARWRGDPESRACALHCVDRDPDAGRSEFASALNRPSSSRWLVRSPAGQSIGIASLDRPDSSRGESVHLQVLIKPAFRNQGYGTALLERMIERVAASGQAAQIIVQARATHHAAHQIARKAGMNQVNPTVVDGVVAHQFTIDLTQASKHSAQRHSLKKSA